MKFDKYILPVEGGFSESYVKHVEKRQPAALNMNPGDYYIREKFSSYLFDKLPMSDDALEQCQTLTLHQYHTQKRKGLNYVSSRTNLSFLNLFLHRGVTSHVWYQPKVNIREFNMLNLFKVGSRKCNLLQTATSEGDGFVMDGSESVGLIPYMLYKRKEISTTLITSVTAFSGILDNGKASPRKVLIDEEYEAGPVTPEEFQRFLSIFGYKIPPDATFFYQYFLDLLQKFTNINLFDEASIDELVQQTRLDIRFADDYSPVNRRRQLLCVIQDITPIRFAIIDGQHRMIASSILIDGYTTENVFPLNNAKASQLTRKSLVFQQIKIDLYYLTLNGFDMFDTNVLVACHEVGKEIHEYHKLTYSIEWCDCFLAVHHFATGLKST